MNAKQLRLTLSVLAAINTACWPARGNELELASSHFSQPKNTIKFFLRYSLSIPLLNIKSATIGISTQIEDQAEDEIEGQVEDEIEDQVEDEIEDQVEDEIEDQVEDEIEDQVEDEIEDQVEDEIEDQVEDEIEDQVEDEIENQVEDEIEDQVEDEIEDQVEDEIEDQVEDEIEDQVEDEIEDQVEDEIEDQVEDEIEDQVEDEIEDQVEDEIEDQAEDEIEDQVEDEIEIELENDVKNQAEAHLDGELENDIDDELQYHAQAILNQTNEDTLIKQTESQLLERLTETTTDQVDKQLAKIIYVEDEKTYSDDWFVLSDATSLKQLKNDGFSIYNKEYLDGLGMYLANLQAPKSFVLKPENYANLMALNTSKRAVDVNHIYELAHNSSEPKIQSNQSSATLQSEAIVQHRLGIIDSAINTSHPALVNSQIISRQFAEVTSQNVSAHGTAVASILVGQDKTYRGMLPGQSLWAATVIFSDQKGEQLATTVSLVKAIDWLIQSDVDIINMSLTGPDNKLLQIAIERACNLQILVVAAAGNNGPTAKPLYPAGYTCTVAVTAIDSQNKIYRRAARGKHIDLAAYGVNILHAADTNAFNESSGTSFAAPLISAWLAINMPQKINVRQRWLKLQMAAAEDLGAVGKDPIYGFGTILNHPGSHLVDTQARQ